jgi:hypothetical protein
MRLVKGKSFGDTLAWDVLILCIQFYLLNILRQLVQFRNRIFPIFATNFAMAKDPVTLLKFSCYNYFKLCDAGEGEENFTT